MQALILAGGSGTRFWPLSRRQRPKQLLPLDGPQSPLQSTVERLAPLIDAKDIWICTTQQLAEAVREQLPQVPAEQILAEPEGRNTAPAIGWSLHCMPDEAKRGVVAVLPADHRVEDTAAFRQVLSNAAAVATRENRVMTLGITPRWAETGYGYLELGAELDTATGLRAVQRFTEKPDAKTASRWVMKQSHLWNAGIFVFRGESLLQALRVHEPQLAAGLDAIAAKPGKTAELYPHLPSISIDYGVMEKLDTLATMPLDCGWSDLGSWEAVAELLPQDEDENRFRGDILTIDAKKNLLYADQGSIAVLGIEGLAVIRTGDTVLVVPREKSQEVRRMVDKLRREERTGLL